MRRNMKKLGCAILCICLLLVNTPGSISYAENTEQYATDTDAVAAEVQDATEVPEVEETTRTATGTDAEESNTVSAMAEDMLLYAASADESGGAYKLEINSQEDWDNLFTHSLGDGSGWTNTRMNGCLTAEYVENDTQIAIYLNADISLSEATGLYMRSSNDIQLHGNGHSIDANGFVLNFMSIRSLNIDNTHIKNGTIMSNYDSFSCTNSQFSAAPVILNNSGSFNETEIRGCKFFNCTSPCVSSMSAPCPFSFSDCYMDNCGLLFKTANKTSDTKVSFSNITAENCTGTVLGYTKTIAAPASSYTIESISGCKLSTQMPGLTAIEHETGTVGEITDCEITGFDTGIKLDRCDAGPDIDTITISDTTITDCITGINLSYSPAVISDCEITDCNFGVNLISSQATIVDTNLIARASDENSGNGTTTKGVTSNATCFLIDCDIKDFDIGSDMTSSGNTAIISCIYQNKVTNLNAYATSVYDTRFIGGETAVTIHNGSSYFYDCVIEGDAATQSGFAYAQGISASLYIHNLARPYNNPPFGYYDNLYQYSDRTVNNGKSEISNCTTGIDAKGSLYIADTHIHDCETGIQSYTTNFYGNNLIEKCTDGVKTDSLNRYEANNGITVTDTHVDTIRNCSNNGLSSTTTMASTMASEWNNRLEIYECGNYGIEVKNTIQDIVVDVHDCKTGIYITADATGTTQFRGTSKIYDNREWNVYDSSTGTYSQFVFFGEEGTLTGGGIGNVYMNHDFGRAIIYPQDLYSDDSVYYLGTDTSMYILTVGNLYGTVVFDTIDSGYVLGRKVAMLSNPNLTSQMFAKKEGFIISTQIDGAPYAVFAAGCDVTYDVTTNGGDTFDDEKLSDEEIKAGKQKRISYLVGENIDLTYTASKTGYEFVGWNTDKDATEGLEPDTLTAEQKDITLYAIYKKTAYINYHTYDTALDYRTAVTLYNNQDIECKLDTYNIGGDKTFVGYVLDEDAVVSSADDVLAEGDTVTGSPDGLDIYCVYEKQGQLDYLKKDGTILSTDTITVYEITSENKEFVYTVRAGEPVEGFTFTGWKDGAGNSFATGATLRTEDDHIVLAPVYVVGDEPTTEPPTAEPPTTDTPTPQPPVIEPPTTETSTPQTPSGPKTGDSTNPIGVIGLGILSLLGLLVLTLKNKRKN